MREAVKCSRWDSRRQIWSKARKTGKGESELDSWDPLRLSHIDLLAACLRNVLPSRRVPSGFTCNQHPLLTNGCLWLYSQLLVQLSISLCCQRNHQTETTMTVLKLRSCPSGNCLSYLWVLSNDLRWSCRASSNSDYLILVDGTIGRWTSEVPSLSWLAFIEHRPYPKYLRVSGAIILALCHLTFLSTSVQAVPFHLVFCMQFLLCCSLFCHVCLLRSRHSVSAQTKPQPYLSIPLVFVVVVFRTKSLSYTSVCKAQRGWLPPQYSGQVRQALVAMGWFL